MGRPLRETSGTYIKPGIDREINVRIALSTRSDIDHIRKLVCRKLDKMPSLGVFIAFCANVGTDAYRADFKLSGPLKLGELEQELAARARRPIKEELLASYDAFYRGLPGASFAEFIVHLASRGAQIVRERYTRK